MKAFLLDNCRSQSWSLEPEPEPPGAVVFCWSRSRKKITLSAAAIMQRKHLHNQQIFSNYDNEFSFFQVIVLSTQGYHYFFFIYNKKKL